jgi:hypothetical protein
VRNALRRDDPPAYQRERRPWAVDAVEPQIRELLAAWPRMPATVIAERIGWDRGGTQLKVRVAELRPLFVPPDPCNAPTIGRASSRSGTCGSRRSRSRSASTSMATCR